MIRNTGKPIHAFWRKWILDYSLGELIGIGISATIARFLFVGFPENGIIPESLITVTLLTIAGVSEGFIIGYIQWRSFAKLIPDFRPVLWILVTTISTLAGWLFILPPGIVFITFLSQVALISANNSILYTLLVGLAFGGLIGIPQSFIVKQHFKGAIIWIISNAVGWMFSFLIIYLSLSLFPYLPSVVGKLLLIALACVFSGLVQGLVTGTSLHFLMSIRKPDPVS